MQSKQTSVGIICYQTLRYGNIATKNKIATPL